MSPSASLRAPSATAAAPGWLTKVRPALAGRVFTLAIIGALAATPVLDPDSFWHIATGQRILQLGEIPKTDPFSWTAPGRKWIAHEWLTESLFAGLFRFGGWTAMVLYAVVTITASWAIVLRTCRRLGVSNALANAVVLFAAIACLNTWGARPQMLSLLFGALFADFSVQAWQGRSKVLWWCVPITLVWCNAHGGYMFGLTMVLLFACGLATEIVVRRFAPSLRVSATPISRSLLKQAWLVCLASIAVSLINPNGVEGFIYPFSYLGDNASTRYIDEWLAPTFAKLQWWPFFIMVGLALVVIWKCRRTLPVYAGVGMVAYGALGLQSVRNITQFSFFAAPWLALGIQHGMAALRAASKGQSKTAGGSTLRTALPLAGMISALSIAALAIPNLAGSATTSSQANEFPVGAVNYLREHPTTNLFNRYEWGGYLIHHAKQPVGIDGRPDMYGDDFVDRYLATWDTSPGWEKRLAEFNAQSVLAPVTTPIAKKLRLKSPEWTIAYEDRQAVLFVKR